MIDIEALLKKRFPDLNAIQKPLFRLVCMLFKKILHEKEINHFINSRQHLVGLEFLDAVLDHFDFRFRLSNRDRQNIPDQGRVIIVANHPLGSLDGLALVKLVSEVRPDVRIVATTLLNQIEPLKSLFLVVDNISSKARHILSMKNIIKALHQEQAVILFPTGEVSRIRPQGIRDSKWKTGFVLLSRKTQSPVLPIYIDARNSASFYALSSIYKPLGTLLLVNEMFKKNKEEISFKIGNPIPSESLFELPLTPKKIARKMRKHVYSLAGNKNKSYFRSIENIVHPARRKLIRNELKESELIGQTMDGKKIFLFDYRSNSSVIREIGRLRELSFRQVKEGTGNAIDTDAYDRYYRHLILWDEDELEIIGTYRIGEASYIIRQQGRKGLYSHSLFELQDSMLPYLEQSIELGRSFIQPRYWGKRSLDYLWYGLGAYLRQHPEIKFMIGPVSLSASYGEPERQQICGFYNQLFGRDDHLVRPRQPYPIQSFAVFSPFNNVRTEMGYKEAYSILKHNLEKSGVRVPTLFKQYVELCRPGGCEFLGFNVDPNFSNCIDAMILVHIDAIYDRKRERYIGNNAVNTEQLLTG